MINWGYTIFKDHQIDFDKNDRGLARSIRQYEPTWNRCIACGACTATCSASNFTEFNIRRLNILLRRGEIAQIKDEIAKCMFCGKCQLVCPRGVQTRNVIFLIKKLINEV